jgi:cyanate permease
MTRPSRLENAVLLSLGGIGYGALMFVWFSLPAYLSPVIEALGLNGTQAGILAGAVPLMYIPLGLFSGIIIDRVGARLGIGAGIALAGVGQFGRAGTGEFPTMLVFTLLIGAGATGLTFGLPKLAAELYPSSFVGRAASVYLILSYAGTASTFALGRSVLGPALGGWRPLFFVSGAVTIAIAAVWMLVSWYVPPGGHETDDDGAFSIGSVTEDVRAVFANRNLRLLVLLGTMYLFITHGLQGWLVTLFEARGLDPGLAGGVTAVLTAGQVVGVLAIPPLAERFDRTKTTLVGCGVLAAIGIGGLLFQPTVALLLIVPVAIIGLGMGGLAPLIRSIPVELDGIGPALTATAVGLVFAVGEIGGFLSPVLIGALRDLTGSFLPGLLLCAAGAVVAAGAGASLSEV